MRGETLLVELRSLASEGVTLKVIMMRGKTLLVELRSPTSTYIDGYFIPNSITFMHTNNE